MAEAIEPFTINIEDAVLDDLRDRLARTRFPDQIEGTGWDYGIPIDYLRELVDYWLQTYDWRAEEARLNQLDQFRTTIDGQSIHFVHSRSPNPDAFPLLLIHGWPGSILEFQEAIPLLTSPGDTRRPIDGLLSRDRPVTARLRLLRTDADAGMGHPTHRPCVHRTHEHARLSALRGARWGLGSSGLEPDRRVRSRTLRRDFTSTCRSAADRRSRVR